MLGRRPCSAFVLAMLLLLGGVPSLVFAQQNWGSIHGTVSDLGGAAIPNAWVAATSPTLPKGLTALTNHAGEYSFQSVPIGRYSITVVAPGFHTLRYNNLDVKIGNHVTYHARLSLGSVTESIEVTENARMLDTSTSQTVTTITASEFDNVARGRSFHTILMLAPGVRQDAKAGSNGMAGISVDGASGSENVFFIDGLDVTDGMTGALRPQNSIPLEFVSQVQVKSGGFEAEFGGATGAVVNVATRGGSDTVHAEGVWQIMSGKLNAGDRGFYQRSLANPSVAEFIRPKTDDYSIIYPGFTLGGPIWRNHLFGFASYMPELERSARHVDHTRLGPKSYTSSRTRQYTLARLDFAARSDLQLSASWLWAPNSRMGALPTRDPRTIPSSPDMAQRGESSPSQSLVVSGTYSPTSSLLISSRYGYKYLNARTSGYQDSTVPMLFYRVPGLAENIPSKLRGGVGVQTNGFSHVVFKDITERKSWNVDMSRVSSIFGQQHLLKGGYALMSLHNDINDGYSAGRFDIFWNESFSRGNVRNDAGQYGYYIWEDGPRHAAKSSGTSHAFYLQDTWRAIRNVSLNLGVRIEREYLPAYSQPGQQQPLANPIEFGWGDKIAPRLGVAWDVNGRGLWRMSASFGLFYDLMKYTLAREAFGGDYWVSHVYRLESPEVLTLSLSNPGLLGTHIASYNNRALPVDASGRFTSVDPNLKPYTSRELTFSLDRQINSRLQAGVRYTRKQLLRAIEDIGMHDEFDNEVYLIGNPGFGVTRDTSSPYGKKTPDGREFMFPKAKRQYDALEFSIDGQIGRTHLLASYTWSRLFGNYAGLANSDEAGRMDPSISRSFDVPTYYFDSSGRQRNIEGRLATDRPQAFKLFTWREFDNRFGLTNIGLTQVALSGGLDSTTVTYLTAPTFPNGRGDMGRLPFFTQSDLNLTHTFRFGERVRLKFEAVAMNALNQAAVISRVTQINRAGNITASSLPLNSFFKGYKLSAFVGSAVPYNPIYGMPGADPVDGGIAHRSDAPSAFMAVNPGFGAYQGPRTLRLGLRLGF